MVEDSQGWMIVVFAEPEWEGPEWQLVFEKTLAGQVRGTIRELSDTPIREQLEVARIENQNSRVEELVKKISVSTSLAETPKCRPLVDMAGELEQYRLPLLSPDFLCMDCARYRFMVLLTYERPRSFSLSHASGSYWGDRGEHPHPLITWALKTRETIRECESQAAAPNNR
jgi:hypothetical protein